MHYCNKCGTSVDMPYNCNYCDKKLCSDHRLPENHNCVGLRQTYHIDSSDAESGKNQSRTERQQNSKKTLRDAKGSKDRVHESRPTSPEPASLSSRTTLVTSQNNKRTKTSFGFRRVFVLLVLIASAVGIGATLVAPNSVPWGDPGDSEQSGPILTTTEPTPTATEVTKKPTQTKTADATGGLNSERIEELIHQEINNVRQEHGLSQLSYDEELEEIADYHSVDMGERDYFSHTSPDGETMQDRYDEFGYNCRVSTGGNQYATGGENIFKTSYTGYSFSEKEIAEQVVEGWMNSQGHRENILRDYWENEGLGVFVVESGGETAIYVTQNFC